MNFIIDEIQFIQQCLFISYSFNTKLSYINFLSFSRYLRCPSAVSVMVLQKLIRAKFGLSDSHHVDILHNQDCLNPSYTLMDVLYIYKLSKVYFPILLFDLILMNTFYFSLNLWISHIGFMSIWQKK